MLKHLYLTLLQINGVGRKTVSQFRDYIIKKNVQLSELDNKNIHNIFQELNRNNRRVKIPSLEELKFAGEKADNIINNCTANKINITTLDDKKYPDEFRQIDTPPPVYFTRGNCDALIQDKKIAIIGTRYPTSRGRKYAYKIGEYLAQKNYVIISGLAIGCDTGGHLGCVENGGQTVAVLPGDVLNVYPKENRNLAEKIIENGGCLISEYPVEAELNDYNFIERDRLQAALSKVVIVIETDLNSGTMYTVSFARRYRKRIACLTFPKSFEKYNSVQGNKKLLKERDVVKISFLSDLKKLECLYE